jgi:hypothetical protein
MNYLYIPVNDLCTANDEKDIPLSFMERDVHLSNESQDSESQNSSGDRF